MMFWHISDPLFVSHVVSKSMSSSSLFSNNLCIVYSFCFDISDFFLGSCVCLLESCNWCLLFRLFLQNTLQFCCIGISFALFNHSINFGLKSSSLFFSRWFSSILNSLSFVFLFELSLHLGVSGFFLCSGLRFSFLCLFEGCSFFLFNDLLSKCLFNLWVHFCFWCLFGFLKSILGIVYSLISLFSGTSRINLWLLTSILGSLESFTSLDLKLGGGFSLIAFGLNFSWFIVVVVSWCSVGSNWSRVRFSLSSVGSNWSSLGSSWSSLGSNWSSFLFSWSSFLLSKFGIKTILN